MKRRRFLKQGLAVIAWTGVSTFGSPFASIPILSGSTAGAKSLAGPPLLIPPLLDADMNDSALGLDVMTGSRRFFSDIDTPTLGYNGSFLGPTIRVRDGKRVQLRVRNQLKESTTVHWHGLHVPAQWDGGPRQVIEAGAEWKPDFTIKQQAATLWYHPHALGRTGEHVYKGLAGMFIIEDDFSLNAPIPRDYGVDDIPLIFQDRRFYEDGSFAYVTSGHDIMHGVIGNYLFVNGAIRPQLNVVRGIVRFRLLNGSNSTIYRLSFSDKRSFQVIASDGGFLERPVSVDSLIFSAAERFEILTDFRDDTPGTITSLVIEQYGGESFQAMDIIVGSEKSQVETMPASLRRIERLNPQEALLTRQFSMQTMSPGGRLTINGKNMDINRIDATVKLGSSEIWEISNKSEMMMQLPHSMHLHDVQFQVLERNGKPPLPLEQGRKDTILLLPGEQVKIISRFEDYTGIYMFHCHMLEHEDSGMMGQFEVVG
ncbi:MAG: multicopper oxidase domain-containing protein [Deltaproteobacteria bacterium]|nr:multicopper oxidase domain-containing protein [Deltaproteobacteria bacterium]